MQCSPVACANRARWESVPRQIKYWVRIGKAVTDNPDMLMRLIQDIMLAREEANAGLVAPYEFC